MKALKCFIAAALALTAMSCAKESIEPEAGDATVSFTAQMPGSPATRAISDGTTANKLIVAVYDANGELTSLRQEKTIAISTTVEFNLVKGKTYDFVFWAQNDGVNYYNTADLKNIGVDYTGNANDEARDAFYATRKSMKITGAMNETITLKRPFSQVNFGTSDFADAQAAGFAPTLSSFTATEAATVFCPFDDEGKTGTAINYTAKEMPTEVLKVNGVDYTWMTMNYFIPVGKLSEKRVSDVSATFLLDANDQEGVNLSVPNAPVQGNYRTNILGRLLTDQTSFTVTIDPAFEQPDYIVDLQNISTTAALQALVQNGGDAKLTEDVTVTEPLLVENGKNVSLDLNGKTITFNGGGDDAHCVLFRVNKGTLTVNGTGTIEGGSDAHTERVLLMANGADSKLIIKSGNFKMGKSTSGSQDWYDVVYALNGGQVEIYGGVFETESTRPGGKHYCLNVNNNNPGTIAVYGGKFIDSDPADGDDAAAGTPATFVAPGYKSTNVGTTENPVYVVAKQDATPVGSQENLNDAIASIKNGSTTSSEISLSDGNYVLPDGTGLSDITFTGTDGTVIDLDNKNAAHYGMATFNNVTINAGQGDYNGFQHAGILVFEDCTFEGQVVTYGSNETYRNCVFNQSSNYSLRIYGTGKIAVERCTFTNSGLAKGILIYAESARRFDVSVSDCVFTAKTPYKDNGAIEIHSEYGVYGSLDVNNVTVVSGYASVWREKPHTNFIVTVDGQTVQTAQ